MLPFSLARKSKKKTGLQFDGKAEQTIFSTCSVPDGSTSYQNVLKTLLAGHDPEAVVSVFPKDLNITNKNELDPYQHLQLWEATLDLPIP